MIILLPSNTINFDASYVYYLSTFNVTYSPITLMIKVLLVFLNFMVVRTYSIYKEKARIRKYLQQNVISQNYFSVLVQGLPKELEVANFYEFIASNLSERNQEKIKKIIVLQDGTEKEKLLEIRKKIYLSSLTVDSEELKLSYISELFNIDRRISEEDLRLAANEKFNGSIIVILEDAYTTINLLQKWKRLSVPKRLLAKVLKYVGYEYLEEFRFEGKFVSIEKVGEPFDIVWQNTGKSKTSIVMRGLFTSIVLWGTVLTYPLIKRYFINHQRPTLIFSEENLISDVWEYTPYSIEIILINLLIVLLINFLSLFTGLRRKSDVEKRKISLKVAFNFISSGLLIAVQALIDKTASTDASNADNAKGSLVNSISLLLFYLIFLPQVLNLIDIEYFYRYIRRKIYLRRTNFSTVSQGELDEIVKPPYFDYSTGVSNIAQMVFIALVSYPIFPFAPLLAAIGLYAASITDRYLLLRRCSDWKLVGSNLGTSFSDAFEKNIPIQIIGHLIFLLQTEVSTKGDHSIKAYGFLFLMSLGYVYFLSNYLTPIIRKHAYIDMKMPNIVYDHEEIKFKNQYEDLYQDYLMDGKC